MAEKQFFKQRHQNFDSLTRSWQGKYKYIAFLRVVVFLIGSVAAIYFANSRDASLIFLALFITGAIFLFLVSRHNKIRYEMDQARFMAEINEKEIKRLEGDLSGLDNGSEFIDDNHPYSSDLDMFGQHSLYQLVNRTSTTSGRIKIASWLSICAPRKELGHRQEAVNELASENEWRQEFQASAMHYSQSGSDLTGFYDWLHTPSTVYSNTFLNGLKILLPCITLTALAGLIWFHLPYYWFILSLFLNGLVLSRVFQRLKTTGEYTSKSVHDIKAYYALIIKAEQKDFRCDYLRKLQKNLVEDSLLASGQIHLLNRYLQWFEARANSFYFLLNLIFLLDIHLLSKAERWKEDNSKRVYAWIDTIATLEAVCSLAGTLFTHNEFNLPEIGFAYKLEISEGGHPLIARKERICNDFVMEEKGTVIIITGSNMSGKSTFLRTLGINLVLGLAGGPVCAKKATIPYVRLFSGMRTTDNLVEHISSFYAELKRIRQLLDLLDTSEEPVFYLLDEILKGTNSKDRHKGAEALIHQLAGNNCIGLVSTHDIALGELAGKTDHVSNFSFSSKIINDEIVFDYKINPGICKSFNASKLMENMGIIFPY